MCFNIGMVYSVDFGCRVQQLVPAGFHTDLHMCDHAFKNKDRDGGRDSDDYSIMTISSTELKMFAKVLTGPLQWVAEILLGHQKTCTVKGGIIQSKVQLIYTILEVVKDDKQAVLINWVQSKGLDRFDNP